MLAISCGTEDDLEKNDIIEPEEIAECLVPENGIIKLRTIDSLKDFLITYKNCDTINATIIVEFIQQIPDTLVSNITYLNGSLLLSGVSQNVDNLQVFENLIKVEGNFGIGRSSVKDVKGFDALEYIGGEFRANENYGLGELTGFNKLKTIQGDFVFNKNSFSNIDGFASLEKIGGEIVFQENFKLNSINGFESLTNSSNIIIQDNESLVSINGINGPLKLNGNLLINQNELLQDVNGFNNLVEVNGWLEISSNKKVGGDYFKIIDNEELNIIPLFESLNSITGPLMFRRNNLTILKGFNLLESSGGININEEEMSDITGFNSLVILNGELNLAQLPLKLVSGFNK